MHLKYNLYFSYTFCASSNVERMPVMVLSVEDKHLIKRLLVKSIQQNACLRCFLAQNEVLMTERHW